MLLGAEGNQLEGSASVLHNEQLESKDSDDNDDEEIVDEEVGENVEFSLLQLSGIEEVEDLEEDKYIEKES